MFLIMSGAYVGLEMESEFGKIPSSFIPLANRRLFEHQIKIIPDGLTTVLSLPESYNISQHDKDLLSSYGVRIVEVPDGLSLGESLVAALNISDFDFSTPLHVLFGDTLIQKLPFGDNIIGVSEVKDSYNWSFVSNKDDYHWLETAESATVIDTNNVVNGYFKFSQPRELIKSITQSHWDFLKGLNLYHKNVGLTPIKSEGWLDFGHVNTYYRSKSKFTTQRVFNELVITTHWVEKSSEKNNKILAEANWFSQLPSLMRGYTPQFLGKKKSNTKFSYRLEYLHLTALNELFVFAELPDIAWQQILTKSVNFILDCQKHISPANHIGNSLTDLFSVKTATRLGEYCDRRDIDPQKKWSFNGEVPISLNEIVECSEIHLPKPDGKSNLLHGDFCFSNILYDFRSDRIKTIDPRGLNQEGVFTIYGDSRYDIAKLSHSILGLYDWIIAGYCKVEFIGDKIEFDIAGLHKHFNNQQFFIQLIESTFKLKAVNLYAMQIQLFLSMLPLHDDDSERQEALLANAFRLYHIIRRLK